MRPDIETLSREELIELVKMSFVTAHNVLQARIAVARRKWERLSGEGQDAANAVVPAARALDQAAERLRAEGGDKAVRGYDFARAEFDRLHQASKAASRRSDRAWAALEKLEAEARP